MNGICLEVHHVFGFLEHDTILRIETILYMQLSMQRPCVTQCVLSRPETPAERAHLLFMSLGLRHLPVVDERSTVCGLITRKDLDHAAEIGPWRRNKQQSLHRASSSAAALMRGVMQSMSLSSGSPHYDTEPLLANGHHGML